MSDKERVEYDVIDQESGNVLGGIWLDPDAMDYKTVIERLKENNYLDDARENNYDCNQAVDGSYFVTEENTQKNILVLERV